MFTGIIEATGTVRALHPRGSGRRLELGVPELAAELELGDSVAVDGTCLTVVERWSDGFAVDVVPATLDRTIAGGYRTGATVNLERAARLGDRLDGHLVQGHVDGVGTLVRRVEDETGLRIGVRVPEAVWRATIAQGSICLNGVSLTVQRLDPTAPEVEVALIPYTAEHTNLGALGPEEPVNVEGDLIGKYVGRMLAPFGERTGEKADISGPATR